MVEARLEGIHRASSGRRSGESTCSEYSGGHCLVASSLYARAANADDVAACAKRGFCLAMLD